MNIAQLKDSKFLKKEDCGRGILVTINRLEQRNVAMKGEAEELKWVLLFNEDIMPMVLNSVNAKLIASIVGSEETDDWAGHQVVLYNDPTVAFAGKIMGGIRVRAMRRAPAPPAQPRPAAPAPAPAPAPKQPELMEPDPDDDVPF